MQRQQIESIRKSDYQALAAAKRAGHLATIQFTLDLPGELADIELTERCATCSARRLLLLLLVLSWLVLLLVMCAEFNCG